MIKHGPVDVVVLAAGEPRLDGSVFAELERQAASGTIRVLDAMLLLKDAEGNRASYDLEDLPPEMKAAVGFIETGTRGLFDSDGCRDAVRGHGARLGRRRPGDRTCLGGQSGECHPRRRRGDWL